MYKCISLQSKQMRRDQRSSLERNFSFVLDSSHDYDHCQSTNHFSTDVQPGHSFSKRAKCEIFQCQTCKATDIALTKLGLRSSSKLQLPLFVCLHRWVLQLLQWKEWLRKERPSSTIRQAQYKKLPNYNTARSFTECVQHNHNGSQNTASTLLKALGALWNAKMRALARHQSQWQCSQTNARTIT